MTAHGMEDQHYSGGFWSDRVGLVEVPAPLGKEFRIRAAAPFDIGACSQTELRVNTERGVRWQYAEPDIKVNWDGTAPSTGVVSLVLEGRVLPSVSATFGV